MTEQRLTATQKVLRALIRARLENKSFALSDNIYAQNHWIRGGFRPVWYFQSASCGGSDAGRQIRFLRLDHDVPIEMKGHTYFDGNGKQRTIPIYRIGLTPGQIRAYDWTEAFETPFNWTYREPKIEFDKQGQGAFL